MLDGLPGLESHHDLQPERADTVQLALSTLQERLGGERQHHVRHPADVDARKAQRHHADDGE
jgi:hypothetical protein